ncbi:exodeoxyribonuclease V subunit beta [Desulfofustis glycolicus]|uniref:DNA 3'-5' helicase n=1 Tax=Desulfofustis glycolicus DSM 9705 TaxID=1121409 RepID=A0A1M5VUJ8_9BACT|nr:exodeoxyribonuclease V subunit beta [Desulfofustis glycolicus]SHH78969.1 DNA helicase/exodeoxyribonuclease V, beta subunit [Desulfofustis glycolicus DSM 9705]
MSGPDNFDPFWSPILPGINLIEASAGTGKTFSIVMLVLRAVVELGLKIDEIQVVTYTSAATDELRERVRARLLEARQQVAEDATKQRKHAGGDDRLADWLAAAGPDGRVRQRLDLALLDIDRAPIQTIHAFCQTVLQEQALESGQLFDLEVTADVTAIRDRLVEDFWRTRLYPLAPRYARLVCSSFAGPAQLYRSIAGAENLLCDVLPPPLSIHDACSEIDLSLASLRTWWSAGGRGLLDWLVEMRRGGYLLAAAADDLPRLADELVGSLEQDLAPTAETVAWMTEAALLASLSGKRLRSQERKNEILATAPLSGGIVDTYLAAVAGLLCALRVELAHFLRSGLSVGVRHRGLIGFDDLITGLAEAVSKPSGASLCNQVGARYRMALIDEFQDTDSGQWSIFSRLFGTGKHYLYLIGDPKQAIYRFRGADIYSYFRARQQADRRLTLQYNYRAHPGLMTAVNRLLHDVPIAGQLYRPVQPAKTADQGRLVESGGDEAGLIYCQLGPALNDKHWSSETAGEAIGAWVVGEVARLLGDGGPRCLAEVAGDGGKGRTLHPEDIAVLVRSNGEAAVYQQRFRRLGIPAVVTGRHSVFQTSECESLLQVLPAIVRPTDRDLLKTALSCDWFGLDGAQHYRIGADDAALSVIQQRFHLYLTRWREQGFLPMFTGLLRDEQIHLALAHRPDARRRLTNIQHLAELIQQHQRRGHLSCDQTVSWLQRAAEGNEVVEDALVRLADDGRALQVVTMHSAKGLEFAVVFCPSLLTPSYQHRDLSVVFAHDETGRRVCDLGSEHFAAHRERELDEEREENLRLAYVAITRATLRCYLLWADIAGHGQRPSSFTSPLGQLLFAGMAADYADQVARLQNLGSRESCGYRLIEALPPVSYRPHAIGGSLAGPRPRGVRSLQPVRTRTSFSALAMLGGRHTAERAVAAFDEGTATSGDEAETPLPSGARFGSVVHEILEEYDFGELAGDDIDERLLADRCRSFGLAVAIPALRELLRRCVTTPLLPGRERAPNFSLADLDGRWLVKEMAFTLSLASGSTQQINELLTVDPACSPLSHRDIGGYLTGFIDLLCRHDGRYYLIDYKTNQLGGDDAYGPESLLAAMRSHHYGLQYWLYTVVLHRSLRRWLPDYRYERHFGGVFYPFLRGMHPDSPGDSVYFTVPDGDRVVRLERCFAGGNR